MHTSYVQKIEVLVRLSQSTGEPRDGLFLLFPRRGTEERPESVLDLLNSRRAVIPFIAAPYAEVVLLVRRNIDWVQVGPSVDPALILPAGMERNRSQRAELRFLDESTIEATIDWYALDDRFRFSDHLNQCDEFVAARTNFGALIWNKHRVRETRILT